MRGIKEVGIVMASTGIVTALLTVFFEWRRTLFGRIRGFAREQS